MSWAAHNPEVYDELTAKAIARKLADIACEHEATVLAIVQTVYAECPEAYRRLTDWAGEELTGLEAEYFSAYADHLKAGREDL